MSQYFFCVEFIRANINYGNTVYWNYYHDSIFHKHDIILHHILISNLFISLRMGMMMLLVLFVLFKIFISLFLIIIFSFKRRSIVISSKNRIYLKEEKKTFSNSSSTFQMPWINNYCHHMNNELWTWYRYII